MFEIARQRCRQARPNRRVCEQYSNVTWHVCNDCQGDVSCPRDPKGTQMCSERCVLLTLSSYCNIRVLVSVMSDEWGELDINDCLSVVGLPSAWSMLYITHFVFTVTNLHLCYAPWWRAQMTKRLTSMIGPVSNPCLLINILHCLGAERALRLDAYLL